MQSRKGGHRFQASNLVLAYSVVEFQRVSWNMCPQVHEICIEEAYEEKEKGEINATWQHPKK